MIPEPELFARCPLPGCDTPTATQGQPCDGCRTAFGELLAHTPGGEPLTAHGQATRDAETLAAYSGHAAIAAEAGDSAATVRPDRISGAGCATNAAAAPASTGHGSTATAPPSSEGCGLAAATAWPQDRPGPPHRPTTLAGPSAWAAGSAVAGVAGHPRNRSVPAGRTVDPGLAAGAGSFALLAIRF